MSPACEDVIRAAVNVVLDPVLRLIQGDPHSWSERPCETCRAVGAMVGRAFGCYAYAETRRIERARAAKGEGA